MSPPAIALSRERAHQTVAQAKEVAILAPRGRDAAIAQDLLKREGIGARVVPSFDALVELVSAEIGAVIVTEEALSGEGLIAMGALLDAQPPWSDLPFIVLANGAAQTRSLLARRQIDVLRNVVLLSRPLHTDELLRAVHSALSARLRQYEARERLEDLRRREAEIRESEAKLNAIANSIDQMVWSTQADGRHDYFNDRWYEFTGQDKGSTGGHGWRGICHPDDRPRVRQVWRHSLATGNPYEIEYRLRHHSGDYRWVLARAKPAQDAPGLITRWYGTCTDIHEDVSAREARFDELTRQRDAAWMLSQDLLVVTDREGRLTAANPSWFRLLGYHSEQVLHARAIDFVHPEDLEAVQGALLRLLTNGVVAELEARMLHRDGSYKTISWRATSQGDLTYSTGRDLTEERRRDAALAAAEGALRQSQKLEMIGQLTGGVAHDFNNLLMAIQSSLNLLRKRNPSLTPDSLNFLDNAVSATERGAALTQRMLAFARKQELRLEEVDLGEMAQDLRDLLSRTIGPQIEVRIERAPDVPKARVDRVQIEMALLNLAVNARDAMDGSGTLTIIVAPATMVEAASIGPGSFVRLSVTDTGIGMDAETLARAMEPFFTTKGVGKGTGLGLSMVHGLATQTGGKLILDSKPTFGTTATIFLPTIEGAEAPATMPADLGAVEPPPDKVSLKLLVVDDDFLVAMGTEGMLEDLGHIVTCVNSGRDALEVLARGEDLDMMITDQSMPNMTGTELARQVRILRPDLPIILATGYVDIPEGGAGSVDALLEKPFSEHELAKTIKSLRR